MLFGEIRQPKTNYILFPVISSGSRKYIPIDFINGKTIIGNTAQFIKKTTLYEFGVLESSVHMAWIRAVAGRLKSDYSYSNSLVYNNFIWPKPTPTQKARIEQCAEAVLDARKLYPDSTLADLYDPNTMPPELVKAHEKLDNAVIVSSDEIRAEISFYEDQSRNAEVFQIFHERIANALAVGKNVIADATNITIKSRKPIIEIGKKYGAEIMGVLMVTPWIACITRDIGREHEVGEDVIIRQLRKFEVPFMNEGFDKLILSSAMSKNYSEEAFEYFDELMEGFEQDNPHHKDTLDVHCDKVAHRFMQKMKIPRGNSYIQSICLALNIGALYHDIGKTKTKSYDNNEIAHYFHHELEFEL